MGVAVYPIWGDADRESGVARLGRIGGGEGEGQAGKGKGGEKDLRVMHICSSILASNRLYDWLFQEIVHVSKCIEAFLKSSKSCF